MQRYEVKPSLHHDWMVVDTKLHHAVTFRKTKEAAQAEADKRNAAQPKVPVK